jgi:hypothetical protein
MGLARLRVESVEYGRRQQQARSLTLHGMADCGVWTVIGWIDRVPDTHSTVILDERLRGNVRSGFDFPGCRDLDFPLFTFFPS